MQHIEAIFRDSSAENLMTFSWDKLAADLEKRAHTLYSLLLCVCAGRVTVYKVYTVYYVHLYESFTENSVLDSS